MTELREAWICDYIRTPFGRYGGELSLVRTDDLGAIPLESLISRNPNLESNRIDEVFLGCANQAGEDNRNIIAILLECRRFLRGCRNRCPAQQ